MDSWSGLKPDRYHYRYDCILNKGECRGFTPHLRRRLPELIFLPLMTKRGKEKYTFIFLIRVNLDTPVGQEFRTWGKALDKSRLPLKEVETT